MYNFLNRCSELGHIVEEIKLPSEFEEAHRIHSIIYDKSVSYYFAGEYKDQSELISDTTKAMIEAGKQHNCEQYRIALGKQAKLASMLNKLFDHYDIMVSNSTAEVAHKGLEIREKIDPSFNRISAMSQV